MMSFFTFFAIASTSQQAEEDCQLLHVYAFVTIFMLFSAN